MDVFSTFARYAMRQEAQFLPYVFDGDWKESEKTIIRAVIDPTLPGYDPDHPHAQVLVMPTFNTWLFCKYARFFTARRATWTMTSLQGNDAFELADRLGQCCVPPDWEEDDA